LVLFSPSGNPSVWRELYVAKLKCLQVSPWPILCFCFEKNFLRNDRRKLTCQYFFLQRVSFVVGFK
jgi:hypothetical protein